MSWNPVKRRREVAVKEELRVFFQQARTNRLAFGAMLRSRRREELAPWELCEDYAWRTLWRLVAAHYNPDLFLGDTTAVHYKLQAHFSALMQETEDALFAALTDPKSYDLGKLEREFTNSRKRLRELSRELHEQERGSNSEQVAANFSTLVADAEKMVRDGSLRSA